MKEERDTKTKSPTGKSLKLGQWPRLSKSSFDSLSTTSHTGMNWKNSTLEFIIFDSQVFDIQLFFLVFKYVHCTCTWIISWETNFQKGFWNLVFQGFAKGCFLCSFETLESNSTAGKDSSAKLQASQASDSCPSMWKLITQPNFRLSRQATADYSAQLRASQLLSQAKGQAVQTMWQLITQPSFRLAKLATADDSADASG